MDDDDVMRQPWACLTCSVIVRFGRLRTRGRVVVETKPKLHCPECGSNDIHIADGTAHVLDEYHGGIPERRQ